MWRAFDALVLAFLCTVSVLCFVQFSGSMPGTNLDSSWQYVLGHAASDGKVFGRDIIFTGGPLASLYTRFFVPRAEFAYIVYSAVLMIVFCVVLWVSMKPPRRYIVLLLPLLLANLGLLDAFFLTAPIAIVMLARSARLDSRADMLVLSAAIAILGIWPLIKGTFAVPAAVGALAAVAILCLRGRPSAVLLLPLPAFVTIGCWSLAGQPLAALPDFLKGGFAIAAHYGDAMSEFDHVAEAFLFLLGAGTLFSSQVFTRRLPEIFAYAGILFVAFKAAFVRDHLLIGGTVLLMMSFFLILERIDRVSVIAAGASAVVGFYLCSFEISVRPDIVVDRLHARLADSLRAISRRYRDPSAFARDFAAAKRRIAAEANLPPTPGTVDLYSFDQALLLASDRNYVGRPVPQSYSAYSPELAAFNKAHLEGRTAPNTILFAPQPIDERYPAIEDGASWPDLLSRYEMTAFYGPYVVLERLDEARGYTIDPPALSRRARFGEKVEIPDLPLAWATMKFDVSLLGKFAKILWKTPPIDMEVTYADGRNASFRLIAGMSGGFLLSPTVETAGDFVALRSAGAAQRARVRKINVHQAWGFAFSNSSYEIEVSSLHVPPFEGRLAGSVDALMPGGGKCSFDTVGGQTTAPGRPIRLRQPLRPIEVAGWAMTYPSARSLGPLRLAIEPPHGGEIIYSTIPPTRQPRPEVDASVQYDNHMPTGFTASIDPGTRTGRFDLRLVQEIDGKSFVCPNKVRIEIETGT